MKELFPNVVILRLSYFMENNLPQARSVKAEGKMRGPGDPDVVAPYMVAADAGRAAAGATTSAKKRSALC